ncbi:PEGA domain-containing protein [bacterium]|nr:MAG: PEGA domain-containing protein [bacterium]
MPPDNRSFKRSFGGWDSAMPALAFLALGLLTQGNPQQSKDLVLTRSKEPAGLPVYTASHALIVGIDKYANLPADSQLRFAKADAEAVRDVLVKSYGFPNANVKLLIDGEATKSNILSSLDELTNKRSIGSDDRVFVYFSGHGQTVGKDRDERGYLIPTDAKVNLTDAKESSGYKQTCIPMQEIWNRLDKSPAKHIAVVADACFSGLLTKSRSLDDSMESMGAYLTMPARQTVTAGSRGQRTWEAEEYGHGVFTYNLINELKKRADEPGRVFSLIDLFTAIQDPTVKQSSGRQVPQYNPFFTEGQMLFFSPPVVSEGTRGGGDNTPLPIESSAKDTVVNVQVVPANAAVTIDGERGTRRTFSLESPQKVRVAASASGYVTKETTVDLQPGRPVNVQITLNKAKPLPKAKAAKMTIASNPAGASVEIDGKTVGKTPYVLSQNLLSPKLVSLLLKLDGYESTRVDATLTPGNTSGRVVTTLPKAGGTPPPSSDSVKLRSLGSVDVSETVREVFVSPDRKRIAVADAGYNITLREVSSGKVLRKIDQPKDVIVRLTDDLKSLLTIKLLRDENHSWISVLMESVEGPKTAKVLSATMGDAAQMGYASVTNGTLVVSGRAPEGKTAVTVLDLNTGKSNSYTGTGSFMSGVASGRGGPFATFKNPTKSGFSTQLVVIGDPEKFDHHTVSIDDSDMGSSLFIASNGSTVAANTGRRSGDSQIQLKGLKVYDGSSAALLFQNAEWQALGYLSNSQILAQSLDEKDGMILDARTGKILATFPLAKSWMSGSANCVVTQGAGKLELLEIKAL